MTPYERAALDMVEGQLDALLVQQRAIFMQLEQARAAFNVVRAALERETAAPNAAVGAVSASAPDAGAAPAPETAIAACSHPEDRRVRGPVMGKPNRFFCRDCKETIE